ncbi:MAG: hypothetical protein ACRDPO_14465 [Streptosporangiaceae bacterium]|jgi:hypothetical protein
MAAAGADADEDDDADELPLLPLLPQAAARSAIGTTAAAVYTKRIRLATGEYSFTRAR